MLQTAAQKAKQHEEEWVEEVTVCFKRDGDEANCWFDLCLERLFVRTGGRHCWGRKESGEIGEEKCRGR